MPRKKRTPDDEPLFVDDDFHKPKRRGKRRVEEEADDEPDTCAATNCQLPAATPSKYCHVHAALFGAVDQFRSSSHRAAARGDFGKGVVHGILGTLADVGAQLFGKATGPMAGAANNAAANIPPGMDWSSLFDRATTSPQQPQPAVQPRSCWDVLGLDPATATVDDVRAMQRQLAAIYHTDKKNPAISAGKIAEINAAAQEAITRLNQ